MTGWLNPSMKKIKPPSMKIIFVKLGFCVSLLVSLQKSLTVSHFFQAAPEEFCPGRQGLRLVGRCARLRWSTGLECRPLTREQKPENSLL